MTPQVNILTPRMRALIDAFNQPNPLDLEPAPSVPDIPDVVSFTRRQYGFAGFSLDYAGQTGLNVYHDGLIAHAGGGQDHSVILDSVFNRIVTVASPNDSVLLVPAVIESVMQYVSNNGANSLRVWVYPGTNDLIMSTAGGVSSFDVPSGKNAMFFTLIPSSLSGGFNGRIGVILSA